MTSYQAVAEPFSEAIDTLLTWNPNPFFLQVGGFDGVTSDPLRPHIVEKNLSGVILEPLLQYFDKLKTLYPRSDRVTPVNCALSENDDKRAIWRFNPEAITRGLLPPEFAAINSFLMNDLLKDTGALGRSGSTQVSRENLYTLAEPMAVACRSFASLITYYEIKRIDILQIATAGYDLKILQLFDFTRFHPSIIRYEHHYLSPMDRQTAQTLLRSHGYRLQPLESVTLAILDRPLPGVGHATELLRRSQELWKEGRGDDALLLAEHLAALQPDNAAVLHHLIKLLSERGRLLEVIDRLIGLRRISDTEAVRAAVDQQTPAILARVNQHLNAEEMEQAEPYLAGLTTLLPNNPFIIAKALSCNEALGRIFKAAGYARKMLTLEPSNTMAHDVMLKHYKERGDIAGQIEHHLALALTPGIDQHPLIRLQHVTNAASMLLVQELSAENIATIQELRRIASTITVDVDADSVYAKWEKYFRVELEAFDLSLIARPVPPHSFSPQTVDDSSLFISSNGTPLTRHNAQTLAEQLHAETVFFVAADTLYLSRYAKMYIRSVLRHSDVPCLVVIHVIGGLRNLAETARSIGIDDSRVIFCGDDFNPASVTTRCYFDGGRGLAEKPVAHYQSVRFQRLEVLLDVFNLPVFVSDIDCLLLRGVRDLLEHAAGSDITLNRNEENFSIDAAYTANLVLVNPTPYAAQFSRFLRGFLDHALSQPGVSCWIDQIGLAMAWHHLRATAPAAQINYFDTYRDINNIMYRHYEKDMPCRFLSLYQNFDLKSLEPYLLA